MYLFLHHLQVFDILKYVIEHLFYYILIIYLYTYQKFRQL